MRIHATLGVTTIPLLSANVSAQQANDQVGGAGAAIANSTVTPAVRGNKTPTSSPSQVETSQPIQPKLCRRQHRIRLLT